MVFLVMVAGGVGAALRYGLSQRIRGVLGILIVNVVGSFLLGFLVSHVFGLWWSPALTVGFCGGFTTFSTASVDTVALLRERRFLSGGALSLAHLLTSVLALGIGFSL